MTVEFALGLALALEGVAYALFPGPMKRMIAVVLASDDASVRLSGLACVVMGVVVVWLIRG